MQLLYAVTHDVVGLSGALESPRFLRVTPAPAGSPSLPNMELFLWPVIVALSGVKRRFLTSLQEKSHNTPASQALYKNTSPH